MENEEISLADPSQLLEAASDFAHYPGVQNDDVAKEFLDRFPLPLIINVLQTRADVPGLESALVACLERIFKTRYGAFLIPHYMPFVQVGLQADSQAVRGLACKTVACLLDNFYEKPISGAQLIIDNGIYPLLLDCVINGNEQVANASMEAITQLAASPKGMEIIFLTNNDDTNLVNLSARCSSLGRVRVLSLIVKLFSVSLNVASAVCNTNLLSLLEEEVKNSDDTLVTLSVLELFYELAEVQHGGEFLSRTSFVQLLSSIICNTSVDGMLRSRAMMISGRLLYNENIYTLLDESSVGSIILAITSRFELDSQDPNECESALEALGQIGSSFPGATLLLSIAPPPARFVIEAAFDRQSHGKQLAALHSLGNITGEPRPESSVVLSKNAEENLRRLIYETASRSSKLTPSGLLLSILKQDAEVRLAAYRVITGLVARQWFLMEICSKQDIVDILTDPNTESTKIGMEGKYKCCKAAHDAFMSTTKLSSNPALTAIAAKLQEAVSRGPYLGGKNQREAQPVVMTQERF